MMRRELRSEGLVGRAGSIAKSDGLKLRRYTNKIMVSYVGIGLDLDGLLANHLNTTVSVIRDAL